MATHTAIGKSILRPAALGAILLILTLLSPPAFGVEIYLGTEEVGSFSHHAGRTLCRALGRVDRELECRVVPAPGSTHNLTNLAGGSLDLALLDSQLLHDAVNRTGQFKFLDIAYDNLKILAPLYRLPFTLVVRRDAGITALTQVKGARFNMGAPRSPARQAAELIFQAHGWTKADFKILQELPASLSQDTMAFCHGSIQAMVHVGVHPDSRLEQLLTLCDAVPVDMDDDDVARMIREHPGLRPIRIPPGTYPELDRAVSTFGPSVLLMAADTLDGQTASAILAALDQNREAIQNSHPCLESFSVKAPLESDIGIPRHPEAEAFAQPQ